MASYRDKIRIADVKSQRRRSSVVLALEYDPSFSGEEILLQMPAMGQKLVENAGRNFFDRYEKPRIKVPEAESSEDAQAEQKKGKKTKKPYVKKEKDDKKGRIAALKISDLLEGYNLYDLLEVTDSMPIAEIKANYKKLVLRHHPDKQGAIGDEDERKRKETHFIRIQEAFEILTDEEWRKKYDSSLPFDDRIPAVDEDFFDKFSEAFHRFSRWSVQKPVPVFGDEDTPYEEVAEFYEFWECFQSWRDGFQMALEADEEMEELENAEDRLEKRWMERQNAKYAAKYKRMESERIDKLVQRAKTNDPRVQAEKARLREERAKEKAAKEYERNRVRLEKEAEERRLREIEEAEKAAKEAERLAEKKIKDQEKRILKDARRKLRVAVQEKCQRFVDVEQFQDVLLQLEKPALDSFAEQLAAASSESKGSEELSEAANVVHELIKSLGLVPIIPVIVEETQSTMSTTEQAEEAPMEVEEDPEEARLRAEAEAQQLAEKKARDAKKLAEKKAKDAKKRAQEAARLNQLEQRRKAEERAAAEQKEKLAKEQAEQAKKQAETQPAKKKAAKQASPIDEEKKAEWEKLEDSRIAQVFSLHREKILEPAEAITEAEMRSQIILLAKDDGDLRGALRMLRASNDDIEVRKDRLLWLLSSKGHAVFEIGTTNPATITVAPNVRNKSKKLRPKFRTFASWALEQATDDEFRLADGDNLSARSEAICSGKIDMFQEMFPRNAYEAPQSQTANKKKKAKKPDEENLDDIFAEMGIEIAADSKKKKKNKK